jgi:flavin reductase (DIM6/NTAB) family NADH-FMN oxidoreductase RutF
MARKVFQRYDTSISATAIDVRNISKPGGTSSIGPPFKPARINREQRRNRSSMTIEQRAFRHTMGQFASGVTVVTTHEHEQPVGITVSSFASLSLDPPLVLICIDNRGRSHDAIARAGVFAVNILAEDQEHLARVFASRAPDKFGGVDYRLSATNLPLLDGVLATIECRVVNAVPGGDHTIFIGEVIELETLGGGPLLYHTGRFGQFAKAEPLEDSALATPQVRTAQLAIA